NLLATVQGINFEEAKTLGLWNGGENEQASLQIQIDNMVSQGLSQQQMHYKLHQQGLSHDFIEKILMLKA
ncbi:hypothetical protein, partial [Anabaena sp. UHCC 0399]|uniref:hypothetical protein n=1 Tax=Anabaena sp. UHCC 0399 TaxID=3110238 RepID=UPI002B1F16C3